MTETHSDLVWIGIAARLWNEGMGTDRIADAMNLREHEIYNRLDAIKERAIQLRKGRVA